jgi:hypothetical protein
MQFGGGPAVDSDSAQLSDYDSSSETQIQTSPRRNIAGARSGKERTAAARQTLSQSLLAKKKLKADDEVEWGGHEINVPNFEPESLQDSIFYAAISVIEGFFRSSHEARSLTNLHHRQIEPAVKFIRFASSQLRPISANYTSDEFGNDLHRKFCRWYEFESKTGPKILSSSLMLRCLEYVEDQVMIQRKFDGCTSADKFIRQIVMPCFQAENVAHGLNGEVWVNLSISKKHRLFNLICPEKWRGKGKHAVAARQAAIANPVGAISMAVMWPIMTENVNPRNFIWYDTLTHYANHEAPSSCRLPKGAKKQMRIERRCPIFAKPEDDQERTVGINIGMVHDAGLLSFTLHIHDKTFTEIKVVHMSDLGSVMFQPYSAASLQQAQQSSVAGGAAAANRNADAEAANDDSLALKCAKIWVENVMVPHVRAHRDSLVAEATRYNIDPEIFQKVLVCTDGEQAPLYAVLTEQVPACRDWARFGKVSAAHSNNVAVPDVCGGFHVIHAQFISQMQSATEAEIKDLIGRYPGVQHAIAEINASSMDAPSKATYIKAVALSHKIILGAITPSVVNDGHVAAGLHPFDRNRMMGKMWPQFNTLTRADAAHVNTLMDTDFADFGRRKGWIHSSFIKDMIQRKADTDINFPPMPANFDRFAINRQGAMNLSHEEVGIHYEELRAERLQVVVARQQRQLSKQEENQRVMFRFTECQASRTFDETRQKDVFKCKCGGKWTNGLDGFKSHEKSGQHEKKYNPNMWEQLYPAAPAPPAPHVEQAPIGEGDAPGV